MDPKRIRLLARRHDLGLPSHSCRPGGPEPCDVALMLAEIARLRAWADFASDLLDAHIWGFGPGDWQPTEALTDALYGDDSPAAWRQDPGNPARILVDPALWPTSRHTVTDDPDLR